jgi:hypothetical protein
MPSIGSIQDVLSTARWQNLLEKLLGYVANFKTRIVKSTGSFQF